jgi:hypothetical protein
MQFNVFDARFAGKLNQIDWDLEVMGQTGVIGGKTIRAWAAGARRRLRPAGGRLPIQANLTGCSGSCPLQDQ